jgi:hypothetical protein
MKNFELEDGKNDLGINVCCRFLRMRFHFLITLRRFRFCKNRPELASTAAWSGITRGAGGGKLVPGSAFIFFTECAKSCQTLPDSLYWVGEAESLPV